MTDVWETLPFQVKRVQVFHAIPALSHAQVIEAAKVYEDLPHQIAAFTILERYVPTVALEEFVETYAAAQKYPACPPTGCE